MWRLGDEQGLAALVAGSVSKYPDDQVLCILALAAPRDTRVIEHIRGKLSDEPQNRGYVEIALAAARAMGELGSDEGYAVAARGARTVDPRQKTLAALAFGAIGRTDAQPYLAPLLRDPDPSVRLAAATAILELGRSSLATSG
jgi:HEAT repeat protein